MDQEKADARAALRATLHNTAAADRDAWSGAIRRHLLESGLWINARNVLVFAALKYEPDLLALLDPANGRRIALPALEKDRIVPRVVHSPANLVAGALGIREPSPQQCHEMPAAQIDLVLVPGLGFSLDGTRLGRGRGHFDRFLGGLSADAVFCGVCFACQLQPSLPSEPHDIRMNHILTELGFSSLDRREERVMDAAP